jgi:hypothetical protein
MITISGSVHRSFTFPAELPSAFAYYADLPRTLNMLPHITCAQHYSETQYRMLYKTTELGIYNVHLMCDIQATLDREAWILRISPMNAVRHQTTEAGIYSLTGFGYFTSESIFINCGSQTKIDYHLNLRARLPVPFGIRFMPTPVVNSIANSITAWRIEEIVEGFIERSVQAYRPQ